MANLSARFDPLLVKNVAKNVGKAIDVFVDRAETTVVCISFSDMRIGESDTYTSQTSNDYTASSTIGPLATVAQQINAEIATALYHFWSPLSRVLESYPHNVQDLLRPSVGARRHHSAISCGQKKRP